mmetsp:Transcript_3259/g.7989  ORF Transcript_3259/g.7989 Transcript_3259/m.7989 type:complete len:127 (+) Transcript_3259:106-486(+)
MDFNVYLGLSNVDAIWHCRGLSDKALDSAAAVPPLRSLAATSLAQDLSDAAYMVRCFGGGPPSPSAGAPRFAPDVFSESATTTVPGESALAAVPADEAAVDFEGVWGAVCGVCSRQVASCLDQAFT